MTTPAAGRDVDMLAFPSLALCSGLQSFGSGALQMYRSSEGGGTGCPAIHTGVVSSGVVMGVQELFNFTPLPKSKSQIFTGDT